MNFQVFLDPHDWVYLEDAESSGVGFLAVSKYFGFQVEPVVQFGVLIAYLVAEAQLVWDSVTGVQGF